MSSHRLDTATAGGRRARTRTRAVLAALSIAGLALATSACGASATANGTQACKLVRESLSISAGNPSPAARQRALELLRQALPLAAIAAGTNGNWQPLEATLSESNRVPINHLRSALTAECAPGNEGNVYGGGNFTQASIPPVGSSPG